MTWEAITLILVWLAYGAAMFVLGAYLVGPTIYHRQLLRWARRQRDRTRPLDPDQIQRRISELDP